MKGRKINRRRFLVGAILAAPLLMAAEAKWLEPGWVKIRRVQLATGRPRRRLVHFTDVHHKGDRAYLLSVVKKINALSPDLVCFTGDIIEESSHLAEALEIFSQIKSPLYGVPGNHDYWSKASFAEISKCFEATGGGWLLDQERQTADGEINVIGASCVSSNQPAITGKSGKRNIFLMHYPAWVDKLPANTFDLLLAGHSHGGQVRLPLFGALLVPFGVGRYQMGMFRTASGPLYVNPGIGWFHVAIRFNCRPEITVFEL